MPVLVGDALGVKVAVLTGELETVGDGVWLDVGESVAVGVPEPVGVTVGECV